MSAPTGSLPPSTTTSTMTTSVSTLSNATSTTSVGCSEPSACSSAPNMSSSDTSQPQTPPRPPAPSSSLAPEIKWFPFIREAYPRLHHQSYFLPPLHFNRYHFRVDVIAGETVQVLEKPPPPSNKRRVKQPPAPIVPQVAGTVFTSNPADLQDSRIQDSDVQDDSAQSRTLENLRVLAEEAQEVMMVLSQLQFRRYLDRKMNPLDAAVVAMLPDTSGLASRLTDGECDVLVLHRRQGLIVGEIKSVGGNPHFLGLSPADRHKVVVKKVKSAVGQLNNQATVLDQLVSDLGVRVIKTLILPNLTSGQLLDALRTDPAVTQALCQCVSGGDPDVTKAVERCLCQNSMLDSQQLQLMGTTRHLSRWDRLREAVIHHPRLLRQILQPAASPTGSYGTMTSLMTWWQTTVLDCGEDPAMSADNYERLVARFCGPATTVEVPTITAPPKEIRTEGEAVAETGLRFSRLALYPVQVDLLNSKLPNFVHLYGPPGTGKTVVLVLKALQWLNEGQTVHVLSINNAGRAVTALILHQLRQGTLRSASAGTNAGGTVQCHHFDLYDEGNVGIAVKKLSTDSQGRDLYLLIDEIDILGYHYQRFIETLESALPTAHVWSAGLWRLKSLPSWLCKECLTVPLRCPPTVVKQVAETSDLGSAVPSYTNPSTPALTEGPPVRWLKHVGQPGHSGGSPGDCAKCGETIADLLDQLRVGKPDPLQYRDVFILGDHLSETDAMVVELRRRQVPVKVVTSGSLLSVIEGMALAQSDHVIVSDNFTVSGLERPVVIGAAPLGFDRLMAMSRCTSKLYWVDEPVS